MLAPTPHGLSLRSHTLCHRNTHGHRDKPPDHRHRALRDTGSRQTVQLVAFIACVGTHKLTSRSTHRHRCTCLCTFRDALHRHVHLSALTCVETAGFRWEIGFGIPAPLALCSQPPAPAPHGWRGGSLSSLAFLRTRCCSSQGLSKSGSLPGPWVLRGGSA